MSLVKTSTQWPQLRSLGILRWYPALHYERDTERGILTLSQETNAEDLAKEYHLEWEKSIFIEIGTLTLSQETYAEEMAKEYDVEWGESIAIRH